MVYFLGRDVNVFLSTESVVANDAVGASGNLQRKLTDSQTGSTNEALGIYMFAPSMVSNAVISGGRVKDVTGVDLSIGVSDTDVGPYFGQITTQKIELRKEHTVSLTRKKSNPGWDLLFNGPCLGTSYDLTNGNAKDAAYMGPRWGLVNVSGTDTDDLMAIGNGNYNPKFPPAVTGSSSCFGYRVHVQLKGGAEIYTVRNAVVTGHTVSINADGTQEETLELFSNVAPRMATGTSFNATQTLQTEM
jgi:hypothetical protein